MRLTLRLLGAFLVAACNPFSRRVPPPTPAAVPAPTPGAAAPGRLDTIVVAAPDTATKPPLTVAKLPADSAARDSAAKAKPPGERCILDLENTPETRSLFIKDPLSQAYTSYHGGGLVGICRKQNIRITADSAESYEQNRLHVLIGNVKYREKAVSLDADRMTYFGADERLLAEGNVFAVTEDSSTITGSRIDYFRAVAGVRATSRMEAPNRPILRTYDKDSTGKRVEEPVELVANIISGEGDTLFIARGNVVLTRTDVRAYGDSAELNKLRQRSRLMVNPFVESVGDDPFTLRGKVIDLYGASRKIERVVAQDSASAVNADLTLTADTIDLRVVDNSLQRAFAFGGRALAVTKGRNIMADSLDVVMPDQRIRQLNAIRSAYAETEPDTAKIKSGQPDWLRGDTIRAFFDTLPPPAADSGAQPALRELFSIGQARSFVQLASDSASDVARPGVNYMRGKVIRVEFQDREVQRVTVLEQASGVFLEATDDTLPPDPAKRPPAARRPGGASSPGAPRPPAPRRPTPFDRR